MSHRFHLTFPATLREDPLVYTVGRRFEVVTNIRKASIEERSAWMILELDGDDAAVEEAASWLVERGVEVERLDHEES